MCFPRRNQQSMSSDQRLAPPRPCFFMIMQVPIEQRPQLSHCGSLEFKSCPTLPTVPTWHHVTSGCFDSEGQVSWTEVSPYSRPRKSSEFRAADLTGRRLPRRVPEVADHAETLHREPWRVF
ncbi:hypothetical protein ElyMa_000811700 [Elysia marginata]|uniref:Uncharacterized protein n=1 Tax=Elysia marginata TaxID=1093978 RepID=A0AAV4GYN5_9GAST|nr:hypothetical protein ElyMa_000811700 [Elysia marginata]